MANFTCASHLAVESLSTGVVAVNEAENCGAGSGAGMLLSSAQLEEFKTEGALAIPGLIPPDIIAAWQD